MLKKQSLKIFLFVKLKLVSFSMSLNFLFKYEFVTKRTFEKKHRYFEMIIMMMMIEVEACSLIRNIYFMCESEKPLSLKTKQKTKQNFESKNKFLESV